MSFLHTHSCEGVKSELDLFSMPPTQTSMERGDWIAYKPLASITADGPLEFMISGQGEEYIDLAQTLFHVTVKITKEDQTPLPADSDTAPVNNWIHSMFSQVDVCLNSKNVTPSSHTYPYRAYIETLLNYDKPAKDSHLTTRLWYKDEAGRMEAMNNTGLKKRQAFTSRSKTVDMISNIHCDIFNQDKFLLNGVELSIKFLRSKDSFHLMSTEAGGVRATIIDATILIRKVRINPSILLAHNRALAKSPAKYPVTRTDLKTISIPAGIQSQTLDNIYLGQLPKRVIISFVSSQAYNGDLTLNPFNFKHFDLNFLSLYADGHQIPSKPLQPDFETNQLYVMAYHTLFSGTGIHFQDEGNDISREDYANGFCLYCFDLTADQSAHAGHWNLQRHGSLRAELRFKNALPGTVTCLVYAEFDNIIEIDRHRNVLTDFTS